jgi:hypothetical protein
MIPMFYCERCGARGAGIHICDHETAHAVLVRLPRLLVNLSPDEIEAEVAALEAFNERERRREVRHGRIAILVAVGAVLLIAAAVLWFAR